jgi:hypothetical protein
MNDRGVFNQFSKDLLAPVGRLTNRSSGRVRDKVPSSYFGARAAQLNR